MSLSNNPLVREQLFIDGRWQAAQSARRFPVINPSTGEMIAEVADGSEADASHAVSAACAALPRWRAMPAAERARILRRWFDLVIKHTEGLATILSAEQGKVLAEARSEVAYGASYIEWFSEEARRVYGDIIAPPSADKRIMVLKQPVGVVATITPWNFPNAMIARKVAPALAVGCTVVSKPAAETPLSALALAALAEEAGVPPGVFNVVCGRAAEEIGTCLIEHPRVRKLSFTGSTAVGKRLQADCAQTMKRTSMELGGNAPFIVFDDADLDAAITGALNSKFRNAGQTCVCSNRFLIQSKVYDEFASRLESILDNIRLGASLDPSATMGPLISSGAASKVTEMIRDAVDKGARLRQKPRSKRLADTFVAPAVLRDVTCEMRVYREEIFGPVAPLIEFKDEADAIELANDTEYGLAAYFYSTDPARIWRVSEALEFGIVGVNEGLVSNAMAPFGGVKASGHGREGSKYGVDDYLDIKYICQGGVGGR